MSIPRNDDGLYSESQSQVMFPNDDDKGKQPLVEPPVPQASTSATASGDTMHRKECLGYFKRLLAGPRADDPKVTTLQAGVLCQMLKNLGMASEVTEDELRDMLKVSGYADENGTLDFERFTVFAEDFKLLESLRAYKGSRGKGELDQGPLGDFFGILEAGEIVGFSSSDFKQAFGRLDMELTDESADSLVRYADLHTSVNLSFEQFLKVLRKAHENFMQRTGQMTLSRRTDALEEGHRRLMAFVSSYTRSDRAKRDAAILTPITILKGSTLHNDSERQSDVN